MRVTCATFIGVLLLIGACGEPPPPVTPAAVGPGPTNPTTTSPGPATPAPTSPPAAACPAGQIADSMTRACITACGSQPESPRVTIAPTCSDVALKDGKKFHDQLTVQLSSRATTTLDCPRMRFRGQDTPVCVVKAIHGVVRGACCPPGHTDPTDPECVAEGSVDEMYKRQKVWEWCSKTAAPSRPCEPCVWVTGAER